MSDEQRPSISSVDARVGRLEEAQSRLEKRQLEQDGTLKLIQQDQSHIREIMDSRFRILESSVQSHGTKLDTFMGKMEALISKGMEQQGDLKATPLGRLVDARLTKVEAWEDVSRDFHAEVKGMTKTIRLLFGTSALAVVSAIFTILNMAGVIH